MADLDATATHLLKEFKHDSPFLSCRFSPDGKFVFAGAQDSRIWRWEIESGTRSELKGHDSWTRGISFAPQHQWMLSGGFDGKLIWWPVAAAEPQPIRTIAAHAGWVRTVAVSPDEKRVATAGNDLVIRIWNLEDGSLVQELPGHESHIYNVLFHPLIPDRLVSGDLKANIIDWDLRSGARLRELQLEPLAKYDTGFRADIGGPRGMSFSGDGKRLAVSGITNVTNAFAGIGNPLVVLIDWDAWKEQIQQASKDKLRGVAWGVELHPSGITIGASGGGGGGFLLFWKADGKEEFHKLKLPNTVRDLDLHANEIDLATCHYDARVRIYRMTKKA